MLPAYVYDLIAAVQKYEDEHAQGRDCLGSALEQIPAEERDRAAAIAHYRSTSAAAAEPHDAVPNPAPDSTPQRRQVLLVDGPHAGMSVHAAPGVWAYEFANLPPLRLLDSLLPPEFPPPTRYRFQAAAVLGRAVEYGTCRTDGTKPTMDELADAFLRPAARQAWR